MYDESRPLIAKAPEDVRNRYNDIGALSATVMPAIYSLPYNIDFPVYDGGKEYTNHLFVDNHGYARIKMNDWESGLIEEESHADDFVCWLRFVENKSWAIAIPYEKNNEMHTAYPDMMIVRKHGFNNYIFDILEPHDPSRKDNLGKAKGFAKYAESMKNPSIGRIQMIRVLNGADGKQHFYRIDMLKRETREKVLRANTNDEIDSIFNSDGFYSI